MVRLTNKRIIVVMGHFGSGKTEFSVNYALKLSEAGRKVAVVDLDIANPYFRSRERKEQLENKGISTFSNAYGYEIAAEQPALTATVRAPLEDAKTTTVCDIGGDESGARVLNQFKKYVTEKDSDVFCVINANRPETGELKGALQHLQRIENETGLKFTGIINNTHMLRLTEKNDILKGLKIAHEIEDLTNIPLIYSIVEKSIMKEFSEKEAEEIKAFPIDLYMRESWLDRKI